jgi:hypothetical protein
MKHAILSAGEKVHIIHWRYLEKELYRRLRTGLDITTCEHSAPSRES